MEIRVLRYFLTVVREEGINRAAEVLHVCMEKASAPFSGSKQIHCPHEMLFKHESGIKVKYLIFHTDIQ